MSNIVLGSATQQNLLALQNINSQLNTTQNHLATGLAVSSATDDAVKYFQSQSLTQRANDLSSRKSAIDQGIQSLTAATNGISGVISILQQMEGLVNGASTQTASQRASAATQFNTLGQQLTTLLNDSSYQGLNLVNSTASNLTLQFSIASTSTLKITGQNLSFSKLVTGGKAVGKGSVAATKLITLKFSAVSNKISAFTNIYNALQSAVFKAQAAAQTLGTNVNFLQTRMSFTQQYMTTLQSGASDLTVADVNQESTNLVTLQTRQSLALQSLSIATSSEQAVLRLFH
ncbi:MAG TPA: flagellin [Stellaceae bacterium]|jgi:flagellin-like hook-associated protein FlgL|nr:flagellin [Stellaceae bacterium]